MARVLVEWAAGRNALFAEFINSTLRLAKINVHKWLRWYLESCAENGGNVPADIAQFLPWNMSRRTASCWS